MATYVPPKRNTAFVFYVGLVSQADGKVLQANPTLAAGDVKIAKDDGAPVNLATLPVVDADFTKRVKVSLSATEMDADQVTLLFVDAAGAEWCDLMVNIQTVAKQNDDLASQASVDTIDDFLDTEVAAIKAQTDNLPTDPADQSLVIAATDAIMARLGAPAGASLSADIAAIEAQTDDIGAAGAGLTALGDTRLANLDAAVSSRAAPGAAMALTAAERAAVADRLIDRNIEGGADGGRTVGEGLGFLRNKWAVVGNVLTVYRADGVTPWWTANLTTEERNAIQGFAP